MTRFGMDGSSQDIDDFLGEFMPRIELLSIDSIPFDGIFIAIAGFEDRGFSFINSLLRQDKKFVDTIGIEYLPYNIRNRIAELKQNLSRITINPTLWFSYDRFNPEKFEIKFKETKRRWFGAKNIILDISGMSKFLIIVILSLLEDYDGDVHLIYSEAEVYHPTKDEFDSRRKELPERVPIFLTKDVYRIITTTSLSSISMQGSPLAVIAFPTFNNKELIALLNELNPQYLIKIEGIPHEAVNLWRLDAIHLINSEINAGSFFNINEITHHSVSTFDYFELVKNLDIIYKRIRYSHKLIVAPTGSKLQTFGTFIFKQMHPEIQIIYPVTKEFAEEYSTGCKNIWHIPIPKFSAFINKLNEHRKYNVKSLGNKIESYHNQIYLLHISDIHIETNSEAIQYVTQLKTDLIKNLKIKKLDYLAISGDIANFSTPKEYDAAVSLIQEIIKHFKLNLEHVIAVPGNHDINWDLSKKAYTPIESGTDPTEVDEVKSITLEDGKTLILNKELYCRRFEYFGECFYKNILGYKYRTCLALT